MAVTASPQVLPLVAQDCDETALFRKSWTLYDAISAHNHMFHREIYARVGQLLKEQGAGRAVLDLGCGNARFMAPCLHETPPTFYHGVDLSAAALEEAHTHLSGLPDVVLQEADMISALSETGRQYEVIFAGFSVHHLQRAEKEAFFRSCTRVLTPDGIMILVDVVRQEGESREAYLDGYLHTMRTRWTGVPPEALEEACTHVAAHDFPETLSELSRMARDAGLSRTSLLARHDQHHVIVFKH